MKAKNKSRKVVECETSNFGVLNINGTKFNKAKWAALERDVLLGRKTKVMLLSETRLMNNEQSPMVEGYHSTFSNPLKPNYRYPTGGVGILISSNDLDLTWAEKGEDWVA